MLLKWILLLIIAWYVSKAVGNIIIMLRGEPQVIQPKKKAAENKVNINKKPTPSPATPEKREIEDARYVDL